MALLSSTWREGSVLRNEMIPPTLLPSAGGRAPDAHGRRPARHAPCAGRLLGALGGVVARDIVDRDFAKTGEEVVADKHGVAQPSRARRPGSLLGLQAGKVACDIVDGAPVKRR